jgi:hypothetical protein
VPWGPPSIQPPSYQTAPNQTAPNQTAPPGFGPDGLNVALPPQPGWDPTQTPWNQGSPPWGQPIPKKKKKWPWVVSGVLLAFVGGCTALALKVGSKETRLARKFISALYDSSEAANDQMCSFEIPPDTVEANRVGLVALRKDLLAKGWKGGKDLDVPRRASAGQLKLSSVKGTLASSPPTAIDLGILKYPGSALCVGNVQINGNDISVDVVINP